MVLHVYISGKLLFTLYLKSATSSPSPPTPTKVNKWISSSLILCFQCKICSEFGLWWIYPHTCLTGIHMIICVFFQYHRHAHNIHSNVLDKKSWYTMLDYIYSIAISKSHYQSKCSVFFAQFKKWRNYFGTKKVNGCTIIFVTWSI